jgi:response regulator RpfG family c-di-GMP phosphodiesterase
LALLWRGRLIRSTFPVSAVAQIEGAMQSGCALIGCELRIGAEDLLVMPVATTRAASPEDGYQLLSFRSINRAMDDILNRFRTVVPIIGICTVLLAICIAALASRAVSRPIKDLIACLDHSEASGTLRPDFPENSPTSEVNQLAASLNGAAKVVEHSQWQLDQAYIEFVETMAQALDARDPYTAGHGNRVRDYAIAIATAMQLPSEDIEIIRVGAQLHDIGKIGIPDAVLQKAGYLTPEEYELIKLHPQIGKRILERVAQFDKYLPIVELHHEDQDGGGCPYGLKGREVPPTVRIVHVADVFDALTSNRAYRLAMPLPTALEMIELRSSAQFDPEVVRAFSAIVRAGGLGAATEIEQLAGFGPQLIRSLPRAMAGSPHRHSARIAAKRHGVHSEPV